MWLTYTVIPTMTASRGGSGPFECDLCGRRLSSNLTLSRHKLLHEGTRTHRCPECGNTFVRRSSLNEHRRRVHELQRRSECGNCGQLCFAPSNLRNHEFTHATLAKYRCRICSRAFFRLGNLAQHQRLVHDSSKRLECELCGRRFVDAGKLKQHSLVHIRVRLYLCSSCRKRFARRPDLLRHMRTVHLRVRPFACDVCAKTFSEAGNQRQHRLIHSASKPFTCPHCPYACRVRRLLVDHVARKHVQQSTEVRREKL